jgi:hypothetical protein
VSWDPKQVQATNSSPGYSVPPASVNQPGGYRDIAQQTTVEFRPISKSRRGLLSQYIYVITHPSADTFEVELGKAKWSLVFVQILGYAIITVILGIITSQLINAILGDIARIIDGFPGLSAFTVSTSTGAAILNIVYVPLFFFIGVLIQYAFARAFYGEGTYLAQAYSSLLYQVPLGILGALITLLFLSIPGIGLVLAGCSVVVLFVYSVVLNIFMIMGAHRLSHGKATAVVLIPYGVTLALALIFLAVGYTYLAGHLHLH